MFLQTQKEISQQRTIHQSSLSESIALRAIKPKLMSALNYEQQCIMRRKKKRNKKRSGHCIIQTSRSHLVERQCQKQNILQNKVIGASEQQSSSTKKCQKKRMSSGQSKIQPTISSYQSNQSQTQSDQDINNHLFKQVYDGNDKIAGYWLNGLLQGQAQITYHNGDYFKGRFQKGYKVQGFMKFKDQITYQGGFYNQQFHGKGVLTLNQKTISAEWVNGNIQSSCVVQYNNGNLYYGPLKQFKKHGYGYLYFPNDTKFFGQFVNGNAFGYGEYFQKGIIVHKGLWKQGELVKQQKSTDEWQFNPDQQNQVNWEILQDIFFSKNVSNTGFISGFDLFLKDKQINIQPVQQIIKREQQIDTNIADDISEDGPTVNRVKLQDLEDLQKKFFKSKKNT